MVFLDDERATPSGWVHVRWPAKLIALLQSGHVEELSLDHNLGDADRSTGYDINGVALIMKNWTEILIFCEKRSQGVLTEYEQVLDFGRSDLSEITRTDMSFPGSSCNPSKSPGPDPVSLLE